MTEAQPFLAYSLNGDPLTKHQGAPLRLIVPGWYGVANVKWLSQIHCQDSDFLGRFQARWYRTLKGEMIDGQIPLPQRPGLGVEINPEAIEKYGVRSHETNHHPVTV